MRNVECELGDAGKWDQMQTAQGCMGHWWYSRNLDFDIVTEKKSGEVIKIFRGQQWYGWGSDRKNSRVSRSILVKKDGKKGGKPSWSDRLEDYKLKPLTPLPGRIPTDRKDHWESGRNRWEAGAESTKFPSMEKHQRWYYGEFKTIMMLSTAMSKNWLDKRVIPVNCGLMRSTENMEMQN